MRFPYRPFPVPNPIVSLGGRLSRPRPLIRVSLVGSSSVQAVEGLVDPGADDTVFSENLAQLLGIDLSTAPTRTGAGFGMRVATLRFAEVTLQITDGQEVREWTAWVGFTSAKLRQPLLGFAGFLQFFTATFYGDTEEVELTVNASYPGI